MKIRSLETYKITLPFRFAFGHSLATRNESSNLIVKITLDNGCCGFGEGVPRDYVTGESVDQAEHNVLTQYAPHILGIEMDNPYAVFKSLREVFTQLGLREKPQGASWCALELAMLDACSKLQGKQVWELIGASQQKRIRYGGVVPFGKKEALQAILYFYKIYGFKTVKLKVGAASLEDDLDKLRIARKILGADAILRVDANCAWNLEQAMKAAEAFRPFAVSSYEQPFPASDWEALKKFSDANPEDVLVDESLCTLNQAKQLAEEKICDAFNVRVSKAGGLLAAKEMIELAFSHGLKVHMGAQVGESGILSAAARHLAFTVPTLENYEGSANFFLLKKDICRENLNAGPGGFGDLNFARNKRGFGLSIDERRLVAMSDSSGEQSNELAASATGNAAARGITP